MEIDSMMMNEQPQQNQQAPGRELPHDLLSEKSLVGCLIVDGNAIEEIADLKLVQEDFYHPKFGMIYQAIKDLYLQSQPIDLVTVCSRLTETGKIEAVGGQSFVVEVVDDMASGANVYHYGKIVKNKSSMRTLIRTAETVAAQGRKYTGNVDDYLKDVESSFFKLTNEAKNQGMVKIQEALKENLRELEDTSRKPGEMSGLLTGYGKLDKLFLGMQPGQLIILGARPAMGKTAFALNVALNACQESKLPVAIFSLEMMATELSKRLLTSLAKVDSKKLRLKNFDDMDLRKMGKAVQELSALPIYIDDNSGATVLDIQSKCRKIKSEEGLGLIVIDYLQLLNSHTNNPSREQAISEMSRALKGLAKELTCPVIALSQLNRSVETRPNKRPTMSDIRESGAIEQDADIVTFIYRDEYYNPDTKEPGIAEVIVGKNRGGELGTAKLAFIGAHTSFENLAFDPDGPGGPE